MSHQTGMFIQSALGRMADEMLAREQFHIRVDAETGRVTVRLPFCEWGWADMAALLADEMITIPPYGRVWVHVE